jgi:hypothetical protein
MWASERILKAPAIVNDLSIGIAQWHSADYGLDDQRFESQQRLGIFLFTTASRTALRPTQPPIQRGSFPGDKAAGE